MNYPFPGMDPYLEHPALWPGIHTRLLLALANQIQPRPLPRYVAAVADRVFVAGPRRDPPAARPPRPLSPLVARSGPRKLPITSPGKPPHTRSGGHGRDPSSTSLPGTPPPRPPSVRYPPTCPPRRPAPSRVRHPLRLLLR